jgi:hypothetical protein
MAGAPKERLGKKGRKTIARTILFMTVILHQSDEKENKNHI